MKTLFFRLLALSLSFLALGSVSAQQLPIYSQFMLNNFAMNPAIAGTQPNFNVNLDSRYQWVGITDAPRTYILTFDGPIAPANLGIGAYVFTDITGPTRRTGFTATCSYHLKLNRNLHLSLGINAGILQFSVDGGSIVLIQQNDQALNNQLMSVVVPDIGAGAYLYNSKFYAGISAPQIVQSSLKLTSYSDASNELATHFYAAGGYHWDINSSFRIDPCIEINYVSPVPLQVDLGARFLYMKKFWLGAGYRTSDAVYAMIGYEYERNLTFGYSYDYPVNGISGSIGTTSEIFIGIKFNRTKHRYNLND